MYRTRLSSSLLPLSRRCELRKRTNINTSDKAVKRGIFRYLESTKWFHFCDGMDGAAQHRVFLGPRRYTGIAFKSKMRLSIKNESKWRECVCVLLLRLEESLGYVRDKVDKLIPRYTAYPVYILVCGEWQFDENSFASIHYGNLHAFAFWFSKNAKTQIDEHFGKSTKHENMSMCMMFWKFSQPKNLLSNLLPNSRKLSLTVVSFSKSKEEKELSLEVHHLHVIII